MITEQNQSSASLLDGTVCTFLLQGEGIYKCKDTEGCKVPSRTGCVWALLTRVAGEAHTYED